MTDNKGELIEWCDGFTCGIKEIDDQHQGLIERINNLMLHATGDEEMERQYFCIRIIEVINYIKDHFKTEEEILSNAGFPGYARHRRSHKSFIMTIYDISKDYREGKRYNLKTVCQFLRNWSLSHVENMDRAYFKYLANKTNKAAHKYDRKLLMSAEDIVLVA